MKTCSEKLHRLFYVNLYKILYVIGFEVISPTFRVNWRTCMTWSAASVGVIGQVNTIFFMDFKNAITCSTTVATAIQTLTKSFAFVAGAKHFSGSAAFLYDVWKQCDGKQREEGILLGWNSKMYILVRIYVTTILMILAGFVITPVYSYITTHEVQAILPILMPGPGLETVKGYLYQMSCQAFVSFATCMGLLGADLFPVLVIAHVGPLSIILTEKLEMLRERCELNEQLQAGGRLPADRKADQKWPTERNIMLENRTFLHNIVKMHTSYFKYTKQLSEFYYIIFVVEVLLNGVSMCLLIFVILQPFQWLPAYSFFLAFVIKTLIVCLLGTLMEKYVSHWFGEIF